MGSCPFRECTIILIGRIVDLECTCLGIVLGMLRLTRTQFGVKGILVRGFYSCLVFWTLAWEFLGVYELLLPVKSKIFTEKRNTCLTIKYVFMICYDVGHTLFIDNQYLFLTY